MLANRHGVIVNMASMAHRRGGPGTSVHYAVGAVPADATKASHKVEREQFKACVLAVQYGMSADGLANGLGNPRFAHANYCGCSGRSETSLICTHVSKTRADRPVTPSIPGDLLHRGEPPLSASSGSGQPHSILVAI
jgi:hypothetical protein